MPNFPKWWSFLDYWEKIWPVYNKESKNLLKKLQTNRSFWKILWKGDIQGFILIPSIITELFTKCQSGFLLGNSWISQFVIYFSSYQLFIGLVILHRIIVRRGCATSPSEKKHSPTYRAQFPPEMTLPKSPAKTF